MSSSFCSWAIAGKRQKEVGIGLPLATYTKGDAALLDGEAQALGIDAGAAKHPLCCNRRERLEQRLQALGVQQGLFRPAR